jgi:hypothetical protein
MQSKPVIQKDELGVSGLGTLEARDLALSLGQQGRLIPKEELPASFQGELVTAALVLLALSPLAAATLISWLLKRRKRADIEISLIRQLPDGSTTTIHIKSKFSESSEPGKRALELAQSIGTHTGLSPDAIIGALEQFGTN